MLKKTTIDYKYLNEAITAIKTNGKSKSVEDYNILDEYLSRFGENPSILSINKDFELFHYEKTINEIKSNFKNSEILFSFIDFNVKSGKRNPIRQVWYIEDGYLMSLWISTSSNLFSNPKLDVKMKSDDNIIEEHNLLIPPENSKKSNIDLENKIMNILRDNIIKEYERNTIGMMSVEPTGELYVKDFSLDKKFKISDLNVHYGDDFKIFHNGLFKRLKTDKKGLVLLHGVPGTGKTFYIRYLLQQLSKTNKKVLYFPPTMVQSVTDPAFFNFITTWTMDNGKNSILLIEDAEPLLSSRESSRNMGITNLLNLTDGILNDILSIQIIATFNTGIIELDDALLRPERLIARKEFKKLNIENAKKLASTLKIDPDTITKEMTLAEIYSIKNDNDILLHGIDKKTAIGEKKSIGFGKKSDNLS